MVVASECNIISIAVTLLLISFPPDVLHKLQKKKKDVEPATYIRRLNICMWRPEDIEKRSPKIILLSFVLCVLLCRVKLLFSATHRTHIKNSLSLVLYLFPHVNNKCAGIQLQTCLFYIPYFLVYFFFIIFVSYNETLLLLLLQNARFYAVDVIVLLFVMIRP